jgi:hypothetical protein
MKQTAVEEAIELIKQDYLVNGRLRPSYVFQVLEQAKEMEKEQRLTMPDYDLEDLATNAANNYDSSGNWHVAYELYKEGFQKAIELLTFKSE